MMKRSRALPWLLCTLQLACSKSEPEASAGNPSLSAGAGAPAAAAGSGGARAHGFSISGDYWHIRSVDVIKAEAIAAKRVADGNLPPVR